MILGSCFHVILETLWKCFMSFLKNKCKIYILSKLLYFSWEGHRFLWLGASWSSMAAWSPRCLPDASQMPSRCLPDASQMPRRCLSDASSLNDFFSMILFSMIPPQGSLLYHRSSNKSPSMIPLDWFLFHDSSNGFTKKLCLGSRAGVIFIAYLLGRPKTMKIQLFWYGPVAGHGQHKVQI